MLLTSYVIAGVVTGTLGAVKYRENKKKRERPWTYRAEKLASKGKMGRFQSGKIKYKISNRKLSKENGSFCFLVQTTSTP